MADKIQADLKLSPDLQKLMGMSEDDLLTRQDMALIAARVQSMILLRTAEGQFLNPGYRAQYSRPYYLFRKRTKGYANTRVTLSYTGEMLQAIQANVVYTKGEPVSEIGYYEDKTDEEIFALASYHQLLGAGVNHVRREFIGLDDEEADTIQSYLSELVSDKIKK